MGMKAIQKFEKWAGATKKFDLTTEGAPAGMRYADERTQIAFDMWQLISRACVRIADDGTRLMSRVKAHGAARVGGAIRDAFGVDE